MTEAQKENVRQRIWNEGMDYCFLRYSNFKEIRDKEFHILRENYIKASKALGKYVGADEE
jgi:hypothetical protein